ncbi:MAG: thioredoxin [Alloprevotella sp.]|nr:thioredoxin [Bacteroidales bacterium]MDY3944007.1 thioredoxin [Alloprevotella sp.]
MAKVFTDANFSDVVAEGLPVVLDFSAAWCGPCQKVGPIIDELATQFEGQVNIGKCDVDENDELPSQYGVRNIPTILFIKNGEVVDKQIGAATKDVLEAKVKALLG